MLFFIVETYDQLNLLLGKNYKKVFVEPIYFNDNVHPALNDVSLLYLKPLNNDKGYILCINHTEALSINKIDITDFLLSFEEIYVRDRKSFIYDFPIKNAMDISFGLPKIEEPELTVYNFFYQKFDNLYNINTIIPLVKHYEKCELIFETLKPYCSKLDNSKFYSKLSNIFFTIEKNGIKIDKNIFNQYFTPQNELYSIFDNKIYTQYNLHTTTGRPSNSFNGINFAALVKDNGCREAFIPENDYLVEIDINSYHPVLASQLIGYDFKDETPYNYFAKEANISIEEAKILMFKQLYGGIYKEYKHIEFFKLIQHYIDKLWEEFNSNGYVLCPISGHKFTKNIKDINPTKLFNYYLQNLETSTNTLILWDVIKLLNNKQSKLVLYTYDSILIDYSEEDQILTKINSVFTKYKLNTKITMGNNYNNMLPYTI